MDRMDTSDSESEDERTMNERIANTNFPPHHQRHYSSAENDDLHTMYDGHMAMSIPSNHQHNAPESPPNDWVFDSDPRLVEGFIDPDGIAGRVTTPLSYIEDAERLRLAEHETVELQQLSFAMNIITTFLQDILGSIEIGMLFLRSRPDISDHKIREMLQYICTRTETIRMAYVQQFNIHTDITNLLDRKLYINEAMFVYFQKLITLYLGRGSAMIYRMGEIFDGFGRFTLLGSHEITAGCNWPVHVRQSIDQIQTILTNVDNRIHAPIHPVSSPNFHVPTNYVS
ncbi:hypothetical protein T484DRAFT_1756572 [Baffinella frigidus]|nr:hypothetical protein T484DRAFT_1756572 [Cryptophyta sp. CCMP2293]